MAGLASGFDISASASTSSAASNSGDQNLTIGGSMFTPTTWIVLGAVALVALVWWSKRRK